MPVREVIHIDEEKCDGCGLCVPACAEGAIQIINGKAKLVSDTYCDGLGACLEECPQDAIRMERREAAEFDVDAVEAHLARLAARRRPEPLPVAAPRHQPSGCPGSMSQVLNPPKSSPPAGKTPTQAAQPSRLGNWPLQIHLVPTMAPHYRDADLLIAADCAPFAYAGFHEEFIAGKTVMIGCPKLDDAGAYVAKLTQIFASNAIRSVEVAFMEVPCCFGLVRLVQDAVAASGRDIPVGLARLGIRGGLEQRTA